MIPLLSRARSRIADMLNARTLAQTVRLLQRQLDHAHLAGQIEEARADRLEERVAELETQLADWREASGELVAEQAADLPDLEPADDSGPPSPLPADPYARAEVQARRADAAERHRLAAEAHAADLENELATTRAQLRQTERSAGAHLATIEDLRALRAAEPTPPARERIAAPWRVDPEDGDLIRDLVSEPGNFVASVHLEKSGMYTGAAWDWNVPIRESEHATTDHAKDAADRALRAYGWTLQDDPAPETQPSARIPATREEPRP